MNSELYSKCMNAIKKYLRMRDWNILEFNDDEESPINFVAQTKEDGELVTGFFMTAITENEEPEFADTKVTRDQAESYFIKYMMRHPETDTCRVAFNEISMSVISGNRAALRLHTNIFNID